jgi:hypothetical protein
LQVAARTLTRPDTNFSPNWGKNTSYIIARGTAEALLQIKEHYGLK